MKKLLFLPVVLLTVNCFSEVRTAKFVPQCANNHIQMSDEQIYQALDSLKNLFYYESDYSFFTPLGIKPKFQSNNPEIQYLKAEDLLINANYIWSRLEIIDKKYDFNFGNYISSLIEYLFNTARYEIKIKPQEKVDYNYDSHQSDVGFSDQDGVFYVKRSKTGKIILMIEHTDSKSHEAKLVKHGNCSYDLQYSSIMLKMKDGTTKTLYNIGPLHEIDCTDYYCHIFTDQFDITPIKVADIVKIRLINFTDKYDYNSKYIGEMISLMQSAAIKNYKESKAQDEF